MFLQIYFKNLTHTSEFQYNAFLYPQVSGPNENLHVVVNDITMELKNFANIVTEEELRKNIHHELDVGVCYYAMELRSSIARAEHVLCHEQFRMAKSIQLSDMQEFCRKYFKQMKIVGLIQGNLSEDAAKSIMQLVETNLGCGIIEDVSLVVKSFLHHHRSLRILNFSAKIN